MPKLKIRVVGGSKSLLVPLESTSSVSHLLSEYIRRSNSPQLDGNHFVVTLEDGQTQLFGEDMIGDVLCDGGCVHVRRLSELSDKLSDERAAAEVALSVASEDWSVIHVVDDTFSASTSLIDDMSSSSSAALLHVMFATLDGKSGEVLIDTSSATLEHLSTQILKKAANGGGQVESNTAQVVEMFSEQGYPLCGSAEVAKRTLTDLGWPSKGEFRVYCVLGRGQRCEEAEPGEIGDPHDGPDLLFVKFDKMHSVSVNLQNDSVRDLKLKIKAKVGVPCKQQWLECAQQLLSDDCVPLAKLGLHDQSTLTLSVRPAFSPSLRTKGWHGNFSVDSYAPMKYYTLEGLAEFFSALLVIVEQLHGHNQPARILGTLRRLSNFPPLVASMKALFDHKLLTLPQRCALLEGFASLFRRIVAPASEPNDGGNETSGLPDHRVFEASAGAWAYLLSASSDDDASTDGKERWRMVSLTCALTHERLEDPVKPPKWCLADQHLGEMACSRKAVDGKLALEESDFTPLPEVRVLLAGHTDCSEAMIWTFSENEGPGINPGGETHRVRPPHLSAESTKDLNARVDDALKGMLKLFTPIALKQRPEPPVRTQHPTRKTCCVYIGIAKDNLSSALVMDPLSCDTTRHNLDALAGALDMIDTKLSPALQRPVVRASRLVQEAIVVLLDTSSSMSSPGLPQSSRGAAPGSHGSHWSRISTVQALFCAFANRSMAYNFPHVVGLTTFSSEIHQHSLTEAFESFQSQVNACQAKGFTALYDGLDAARKQLNDFAGSCRNASQGLLKRIIVLSDGADNRSKVEPGVIAGCLQGDEIVVDAIVICDRMDQHAIVDIAPATGGVALRPETVEDAMRIFECEPILSLHRRHRPPPAPLVCSEEQLLRVGRIARGSKRWSSIPSANVPTAVGGKALDARLALKRPSAHKIAPPRVQRIMREFARYTKNPHPAIEALPSDERVDFWHLLLRGPQDTPYAKGVFHLWLRFPASYPTSAPECRFHTKIYHCNINSSGKVCHGIFDRNWTPDLSVREVLDCIYGLLLAPEPDDPLDSVLAEQFLTEREKYTAEAVKTTVEHASGDYNSIRSALLGDGDEDSSCQCEHPAHLVCPITLSLLNDPVTTKYGHTYERAALLEHLQHSETDPLTRQPLTCADMFPTFAVTQALREYKQSAAW